MMWVSWLRGGAKWDVIGQILQDYTEKPCDLRKLRKEDLTAISF